MVRSRTLGERQTGAGRRTCNAGGARKWRSPDEGSRTGARDALHGIGRAKASTIGASTPDSCLAGGFGRCVGGDTAALRRPLSTRSASRPADCPSPAMTVHGNAEGRREASTLTRRRSSVGPRQARRFDDWSRRGPDPSGPGEADGFTRRRQHADGGDRRCLRRSEDQRRSPDVRHPLRVGRLQHLQRLPQGRRSDRDRDASPPTTRTGWSVEESLTSRPRTRSVRSARSS